MTIRQVVDGACMAWSSIGCDSALDVGKERITMEAEFVKHYLLGFFECLAKTYRVKIDKFDK